MCKYLISYLKKSFYEKMELIQYYNGILSLIGIINVDAPFLKFIISLNLILFIISYSPIFYNLYLAINYESATYILNSIPNLRDILFVVFFYKNVKLRKYIFEFMNIHYNIDQKKKISIGYICFIVFSFVLAVILSMLNYYDHIRFKTIEYIDIHPIDINQTNNISIETKTTLVFFNVYFTMLINAIIIYHFILIFNCHASHFAEYTNALGNDNYQLYVISQQLIEVKHNYNESVSKYNKIFSITVSCGIIIIFDFLANVIKDHTLNSTISYFTVIIFSIVILAFHSILNKINDSIDDLKQFSANPKYMKNFLSREKNNYTVDISDSDKPGVKNLVLDIENAGTLDWLAFNTILDGELSSFDLFGFDWDNGGIIIKIAGLVVGYFVISNPFE